MSSYIFKWLERYAIMLQSSILAIKENQRTCNINSDNSFGNWK